MSNYKSRLPLSFWIAMAVAFGVSGLLAVTTPKQIVPGIATIVGFLLVCFMPRILRSAIGYERRLLIYEQVKGLDRVNGDVWDKAEQDRELHRTATLIPVARKRDAPDCDDNHKPDVRALTRIAH